MKLKPPQEPRRRGVERLVPKPDLERRHNQKGKALVGHAWQPIRPLSRVEREYDVTFLDAWRDRWGRRVRAANGWHGGSHTWHPAKTKALGGSAYVRVALPVSLVPDRLYDGLQAA